MQHQGFGLRIRVTCVLGHGLGLISCRNRQMGKGNFQVLLLLTTASPYCQSSELLFVILEVSRPCYCAPSACLCCPVSLSGNPPLKCFVCQNIISERPGVNGDCYIHPA